MAAFGNYRICFKSVKDMTLEEVFGVKPLKPSEATKLLWKVIKSKSLGSSEPK